MPTQQQAPKARGAPPVLMSLTISVFSPMAAMASTMKNLLSVLMGGKDAGIHPKVDRDGGQKAGRDKIENEKGEDGLETDPFPLAFLPLPGIEKGQHQGDGDDGQGAGELHGDRFVQGGGSQSPHAVPGGRGCGDRGGVVDCGAGEDAESLSRSGC